MYVCWRVLQVDVKARNDKTQIVQNACLYDPICLYAKSMSTMSLATDVCQSLQWAGQLSTTRYDEHWLCRTRAASKVDSGMTFSAGTTKSWDTHLSVTRFTLIIFLINTTGTDQKICKWDGHTWSEPQNHGMLVHSLTNLSWLMALFAMTPWVAFTNKPINGNGRAHRLRPRNCKDYLTSRVAQAK